ncbi:tyrosine-type recombinase/integrase (plasmid) [Pontibacillus sp. ALD_SL1]|uniref:tyrosine-type recombinase/integrase n=1 Tax=Pontibacillus sp. ALD_SL1 TaxID=2777185 RepID=UPI001A9691C5|nr:tyrosine-type recombinase/integrase [Pontibacillus sp. ALD_SL1]QST02332.1 tyrosine-type recombinase/integrase [Pontibacillus sp. ALD_SL1]
MKHYVELFLGYMEYENASQHTLRKYKSNLESFVDFVESLGVSHIADIKTMHIDLYQADSFKKGNGSNTLVNKISVLRSFFSYLESREHIGTNPMQKIKTVKVKDQDRKPKENLTLKEAMRLIDMVEKNSIPYLRLRNKVLILSFLFFGIRVSELCHLKTEDISFSNKTVYIKGGKNGKDREVPLFDEIIPYFKTYIQANKKKGEFLFTRKKTNEPLTERAALSIVKHHAKKARIYKNIGCHSLRRTSATLLLEAGVDLRKIQMFLGHSSINTTMIYLNIDSERMKQEIRSKSILSKELKKQQGRD